MRVSIVVLAALFVIVAGPLTAAQASWKNNLFGIPNERFSSPKTKTNTKPDRTTARRLTRSDQTTSRRRNRHRSGSMRGMASYYWQPQRVASGGWFNPNALTAAHKTLRFGTRVRVTNLRNGRSVVVRINDRGPYIKGRIIDLSRRAATIVGMRSSGVAPVRLDIL